MVLSTDCRGSRNRWKDWWGRSGRTTVMKAVETITKDEKMTYSLCKTCPTCGSNDTKKFEGKCTIMPESTIPHYFCSNCKTLWGIGRPPIEKNCGR